MFAVVLDTCVLWPSLQRDFLLSLAVEGLYRPLWSSVILDELNYHESQKLVDRGVPVGEAASRAEALVAQMAEHFDDARVEGWEPLEGTFHLPDPNDEHVLAAAVMGGAGAIVTENLKDFPKRAVPNHIDVVPAKQFAYETALVDPQRAPRGGPADRRPVATPAAHSGRGARRASCQLWNGGSGRSHE